MIVASLTQSLALQALLQLCESPSIAFNKAWFWYSQLELAFYACTANLSTPI